jgi:hypothetical protein
MKMTINLSELEQLARAATPQNFDSAKEDIRIGGVFECPLCGGEGEVELSVDYCNYDNAAMGVQFYGIGKEFRTAESYYRAANPQTVLKLCEIIRAQHEVLADVGRHDERERIVLHGRRLDEWLSAEVEEALAKANELGVSDGQM